MLRCRAHPIRFALVLTLLGVTLGASSTNRLPINSRGATIILPSVAGYGGTLVYSACDVKRQSAPWLVERLRAGLTGVDVDTATITLISTTEGPAFRYPRPAPRGKRLVYFIGSFSHDITFRHGLGITSVTLPAAESTSGRRFKAFLYNVTTRAFWGIYVGALSGQRLDFPLRTAKFPIRAGDEIVLVVTEI